MASKFGVDATGLEAPELKSAKFISEGVVDKSGAEMAEVIGGTILSGLEEYKKGRINYELEKERIDVEDAIKGFFADPLMAENVDMLSEQTSDAFTPEEDQALKDATDRLAQLRNAYNSTGTPISDIELKARVESLTKNYINRYPGLANEFRTVAANELGDYATRISMIQAQRKAAQKDQGIDLEWAQKEAIKKGLDAYGDPFESWYPKLLEYNRDEQTTVVVKNLHERGIIKKQEILNRPDIWGPTTKTISRTYQAKVNAIINSNADVATKSAQLEGVTLETLNEIGAYNPAGTSDPKVTALSNNISEMKKLYQDLAKGVPQSEASKNRLAVLNNGIELGILQDPELSGVFMFNKLFGDSSFADLIKTDADMTLFAGGMKRVMNGDYPVAQANLSVNQLERDKQLTRFLRQLQGAIGVAGDKSKKITAEDVTTINLTLRSLADGIGKEKTPAAYDGLIELMGSKDFIDYNQNFLPPDVTQKLVGEAETFITDSVVSGFSGLYDKDTMKLQTTSDGRFLVTTTSADPKVRQTVSQINRDFTPRLSTATRASAHVQGSTNYGAAAEKLSMILEDASARQKEAKKQEEAQAKGGKRITFLPVPRGEEDTKIRVTDWMWGGIKSVVAPIGEFGKAVVEGPQK